MTQKEAAMSVLKTLHDGGFQAFLVGGCVRDLLLGREPKDFDVTTNARPEQVQGLFPKTVPVGASFGVITVVVEYVVTEDSPAVFEGKTDSHFREVHIENHNIEVATFRSDGEYADGRHPDSVSYSDSAEEDVSRRDFTINGLLCVGDTTDAYTVAEYEEALKGADIRYTVQDFDDSVTYGIVDHVEGYEDLKGKTIRCIGDPNARFSEDALRMLRACRFAAQLGFDIAPDTWKAIAINAPRIQQVSAERIAIELLKIVSSPHPTEGLAPLIQTGLIDYLPFVKEVKTGVANVIRRFQAFPVSDPLLGMAMLLSNNDLRFVKDACFQLKLSNDQTADIAGALNVKEAVLGHALKFGPSSPNREIPRLKRLMRTPGAYSGLTVAEQDARLGWTRDGANSSGACVDVLLRYLRSLTIADINPERLITGDDLIAIGMKPGKNFRSILEDIENRQLNGDYITRAGVLQMLKTSHEHSGAGE